MNDEVRRTTLTGRTDEVSAVLQRARLDGRLGTVHSLVRLGEDRAQVDVELRGLPVPVHRPAPPTGLLHRISGDGFSTGVTVTVGVVLVAAGAAAGYAVYVLVAAAVAWLIAHLALLVGGGVALGLLSLLAAGGKCPGLHCGGCRG